MQHLDHLSEELVDLVLTVTEVAALDEVVNLLSPSTAGSVQLEGPQEVAGVLEVGSDGEDLVDQVFDADDSVLAEVAFDDVVVGQGGTLSLHLSESSLVDKFSDGLQVGGSPGDVGLADSQHVDCGLVKLDEDTVVDLAKTEKLEDLTDLGGDLVDTTDTHHEGELGLSGNIVVAFLLSFSLQSKLVELLLAVFLAVLLGSLEDFSSLGLLSLLDLEGDLSAEGSGLCLALAPL